MEMTEEKMKQLIEFFSNLKEDEVVIIKKSRTDTVNVEIPSFNETEYWERVPVWHF